MEEDTYTNPNEEAIVRCETTAGTITMQLIRAWSPIGYDRAVELFERKFYDHSHFYRVVPHFLVQFGISYSDDRELIHFANTPIKDDPQLNPKIPFVEGTISYAGSGDNSRTSQLFISYGAHKSLGTQKWETPIGQVIEGMDNAHRLYSYGDMPPWGHGPEQPKIHAGPQYIEENFPKIDKFTRCKVQRSTNPITKPKQHVVATAQQEHNQHNQQHAKSEQQKLDADTFEQAKLRLRQDHPDNYAIDKDQIDSNDDKEAKMKAFLKEKMNNRLAGGGGLGGGESDLDQVRRNFHKNRGNSRDGGKDGGLDIDRKLEILEEHRKQRIASMNGGDAFELSGSGSVGGGGANGANTVSIVIMMVMAFAVLVILYIMRSHRRKVVSKSN